MSALKQSLVADVARDGLAAAATTSTTDACVTLTATATLRVPCPGRAHARGEECLICDEENSGTISVVITQVELEALAGSAHGVEIAPSLSPRLHLFGLVHEVAGRSVPTERGYALLAEQSMHEN